MKILGLTGVSVDGVCAALPQASEDNLARCTKGGQHMLVSGFGGGLSSPIASITLSKRVVWKAMSV